MSAEKIEIDPMDRPVWHDKGFAKVLNVSVKKAEHLRRSGLLDVDKVGERCYASTARRLLASLRKGTAR